MTIVHKLHVIYNPFSCIIPHEDVPHTLNCSSHALIADRSLFTARRSSPEGARSVARATVCPYTYMISWGGKKNLRNCNLLLCLTAILEVWIYNSLHAHHIYPPPPNIYIYINLLTHLHMYSMCLFIHLH